MVAINLTMRYLAWDLETNLLIFQCSFIFVIPVCPDPAASCEVTKQNKEDLSVEMTKNVCRDDVHQENAHDCAPVFQGLLSVSFLHSALLKLMRTLLRSFPSGTQAPRNTESTTTPPTPKSLPTVGWIRDVPCQRVDSQQLLTQYFVQSWRSFALITTQAPNSLPIWMTGTCGSNRNFSYRQLLLSKLPPDQSTLLYRPPKHKYGKVLAKTEFQDKVTLTLSCLGGHLQIHGDAEPSPVVLGEQATMEKTTQRFQKIATTLADLYAEGLNVQTVNDVLTMYVGAASQHALRVSFVHEQEAQNFDRQVITYWSSPHAP